MFEEVYKNACVSIGFRYCYANIGFLTSEILTIVFGFAGMYMLVNIVMGGITLMTGSGDPAATKKGYGMVQYGIIGFLIVAGSYMVIQAVSTVLGLKTI